MNIINISKYYLLVSIIFVLLFLPTILLADGKFPLGKAGDYNQVIVLMSDGVFDSIDQVRVPDPGLDFFQNELDMSNEDANAFIASSETFFRDQFGIDFTDVPLVNGVKEIPNVANLVVGRFTSDIEYRAIYMNGKGVDLEVQAGGVFLTITGTDVVYKGVYGGVRGKRAFPGDLMVSGFYSIARPHRIKPVVIRFKQGNAPTRLTFEGWNVFMNVISSSIWGDGMSDGAATIEQQLDGRFHSVIRNVLTFPGRLADTIMIDDD